jgi:hypothetical protein
MQVFKSLGAALMHYFQQEPNWIKVPAAELVAFKNSLTPAEQVAAKRELESYGYQFAS